MQPEKKGIMFLLQTMVSEDNEITSLINERKKLTHNFISSENIL